MKQGFLLLFLALACCIGMPRNVFALLAAHLDYDGCNTCHKLHGGPSTSGLAAALTTEATCLGCHGPLGIATEAAIHDPGGYGVGNSGYITCRECHDAHDNQGGNIRMIGYRWDPETDPGQTTLFAAPTIRVENPALPSSFATVVFTARPADFNRDATGDGACQICHAAGPAAGADTDLNSHQWGDCVLCHGHGGGFVKRQCVECHDRNATLSPTAPKMVDKAGATAAAVGSHLQVGAESIVGLSDLGWTIQCIQCHAGHAGDILVPNNAAVGIDYPKTGGIGLGGKATLAGAASEAAICWDCHASRGISEWETNTRAATGNSLYHYGSLSGPLAPAWVDATGMIGATWTSPNFAYKTGAIQSTHAVDGEAAAPGLDPAAAIRCSFCHDVHEMAKAPGDTAAGKPYLRGTWKGNPYREDGAPLASSTYTAFRWGPVPRGSTMSNEYGGYQIDQNNAYPTAGGTAPTWNAGAGTWGWPITLWTLDSSAGLCVLCHGADVDNLNTFGAAADDWVGSNGHSNAVIGGTGEWAANIFRTSLRAPSGVNTDGANPDMGYRNHGSGAGYGFRGTDGRSFRLNPSMVPARPYGGNFFQWGAQVDEGTTEKMYHQFSCSKCHNPHASRLPRLLITNCLDTRHNTWDDPRVGVDAIDQSRTNANGITLSAATSPDNWGRTWSNTTSAQNCHRLAGDNRASPVPGYGGGWNRVSPW